MKIGLSIISLLVTLRATADVPDRAVIGGRADPGADRIAIVRWPAPIDAEVARAFATAAGGVLVSIPDETENQLVACLRNTVELALGACDGPWIGLERPAAVPPGQSWRWIDRTPLTFTDWSEGSPSGSVRITAAAALLDDGTWIDAMPSVDAGSEIRSAAIAWSAASDQDGDGIPDTFPSGAIPTIVVPPHLCGSDPADLDGNGRVDSADLAIVLAAWGTSQDLPDLDDDGTVGPLDLGRILAAWSGD